MRLKKIKILHVLSSPRAEGTPRLVQDWIECDSNIDHHVLFLRSGENKALANVKRITKNVFVNERNESGIKRIFGIIKLVNQETRINKPDLVIAWTTGQSQYIHLGAWLGGIRRFILHAGNPPATSGFLARFIYSWLTFWSAWIINAQVACCSEYVKSMFLKLPLMPRGNFHAIYNCFDAQKFISKIESQSVSKKAIMVATLEPHKDHRTLIHAWKLIEQESKEYQLLLAGDGSLRMELENLAQSYELSTINFLGSRNDISTLLHPFQYSVSSHIIYCTIRNHHTGDISSFCI